MVDLVPNLLVDLLTWNTPVWGFLINAFNSVIGSTVWAVFVLTLAVKLILTPIDFINRRSSRKNAKIQSEMQPELDKIKQKYANSPEVMQQKLQEKQMQMLKKTGGSCVTMLIYFAITAVVFVTLFNTLNYIAKTETTNLFTKLNTEYTRVIDDGGDETDAKNAVLEYYKSGNAFEGWLWVKNIWVGDKPISPIPNYKEFIAKSKYSSDTNAGEFYLTEEQYNNVMGVIKETEKGVNGYYILIILVGLLNYFSFEILQGKTIFKKKKKEEGNAVNNTNDKMKSVEQTTKRMGGILKFILPVVIVLVALFSNTVFTVYLIASSLFTIITAPIYNKIFKNQEKKEGDNPKKSNKKDEIVVDYKIQKNTIIKD